MNVSAILKTAAVKLPPLEILATLAASMSTPQESPDSTAKRALAVWKSCAVELEAAEKSQSEFAAISADLDMSDRKISAVFANRKTIPFEEFLKYVMPDERAEDRARRYRGYLRWNLRMNGQEGRNPLAESELDKAVSDIVCREKSEGIFPGGFTRRVNKIREVVEFEKKEGLSKRGEKGAKARLKAQESGSLKKALGGSPKAKKTPQAKRIKRQVRR